MAKSVIITVGCNRSGQARTSSRVKVMNLKPLEDMVTCPIDLTFLEDPRLLPCGHVFCRHCLDACIHQIISPSKHSNGANNPAPRRELSCPICRAPHAIPESGSATDYPKSFNHSMILEYIRSQAFIVELCESGAYSGGASSSRSSFQSPSPVGSPKPSFSITSDALDSLVADIVALKQTKSNTVLNLAQLLHSVRRLVDLQQESKEMSSEPSAPPPPPPSPPPDDMNGVSTRRDTAPRNHGINGRFQSAAQQVLGTEVRRSDEGRSSYTCYRELLTARTRMMRNCHYRCLRKNLGQCDGMPPEVLPYVSMHLLPDQMKTHIMQYTLAPERCDGRVYLWRRRVSIHPGRESFSVSSKSVERGPESLVRQQWTLDDVASMGRLEVQYVRFFRTRVYMSVIVRQSSSRDRADLHGDSGVTPDLVDPGLVICCALPDPNHRFTSNEFAGAADSSEKNRLNVIDVSSIFLRDSVGMVQLDRPTIAGLDVDRETGAVYVALCANAMVCRLSPDNLKLVDKEWFLNEPQLSPTYLCIARQMNEVWASCPLDDKVLILDLATDTFTQFTPSVMFSIVPSHIICTTDNRIMLLDKKWSRIYWLQRVQQSICSQRVDHTLKERKKRGIDIIQPVDDTSVSDCLASSRTSRFCGGIMCADKKGAYLIYPRHVLSKANTAKSGRCW